MPTLGELKNKTCAVTTYILTDFWLEYLAPETHGNISVVDAIQMNGGYSFMVELFFISQSFFY